MYGLISEIIYPMQDIWHKLLFLRCNISNYSVYLETQSFFIQCEVSPIQHLSHWAFSIHCRSRDLDSLHYITGTLRVLQHRLCGLLTPVTLRRSLNSSTKALSRRPLKFLTKSSCEKRANEQPHKEMKQRLRKEEKYSPEFLQRNNIFSWYLDKTIICLTVAFD